MVGNARFLNVDDTINWFCHCFGHERYRRKRTTDTGNVGAANTICLNINYASTLTRWGKLSNEKGLKLVRETGAAGCRPNANIQTLDPPPRRQALGEIQAVNLIAAQLIKCEEH